MFLKFQLFFEAEAESFSQYQISLRKATNGNNISNPKPLSTCSVVAPPGIGTGRKNYQFLFKIFFNINFYMLQKEVLMEP